ncbi:MAG: NADH-quinone oxidoreductase subunit H [Bacillota bacterium]|nr:NADH-quinone oxidoreductase subunit H [Bacillota bacterium]
MEQYLIYIIQSLILILLSPFFMGVIRRLKAFIRGYTGASLFQPYFDLARLFRKGRVISTSSSFVTRIAPIISFAASASVMFLIPVFYTNSSLLGNLFVVIFLMSIIKFANVLLGLDCASTFGGMGSSRELFISMFAEPVMFVIITFLYIETKSFNIYKISAVNGVISNYGVAHIIAAIAFFILLIAENARMPVDNPETHLELTMIHEAMILDLSGRDLALVELSSYMKFIAYITIFINCFCPFGIAQTLSFAAIIKGLSLLIIKMLICLGVISFNETLYAKFRLFRIPEILAASFSIGIVAIAINFFR